MTAKAGPAAATSSRTQASMKQQLISCRLAISQRRLLEYLDGKYGEGNYEVVVRTHVSGCRTVVKTACKTSNLKRLVAPTQLLCHLVFERPRFSLRGKHRPCYSCCGCVADGEGTAG
jgi:hypothetical protein